MAQRNSKLMAERNSQLMAERNSQLMAERNSQLMAERIYSYEKFLNLTIFGRTELRISRSGAKFDEEADFDARSAVGPPKPHQIDENLIFQSENFAAKFFFRRRKLESCKSSETRIAEVSRRSEQSVKGKPTFKVRRRGIRLKIWG